MKFHWHSSNRLLFALCNFKWAPNQTLILSDIRSNTIHSQVISKLKWKSATQSLKLFYGCIKPKRCTHPTPKSRHNIEASKYNSDNPLHNSTSPQVQTFRPVSGKFECDLHLINVHILRIAEATTAFENSFLIDGNRFSFQSWTKSNSNNRTNTQDF